MVDVSAKSLENVNVNALNYINTTLTLISDYTKVITSLI